MKNSLVALLLSCVLVAAGLSLVFGLWAWAVTSFFSGSPIHYVTTVEVVGFVRADVEKTAAAIQALKLSDVEVRSHTEHGGVVDRVISVAGVAVYLFFSTALVLVVWKRVCGWMGIQSCILTQAL